METNTKEMESLSNDELLVHADNIIDEYEETIRPYEIIVNNALEDELFLVRKVRKLNSLKSNLLKKLGFRTIIHFIACAIVYGGINLFRAYPLDSMIGIYIGQLIAFYSMDIIKEMQECDWHNRKQIYLERENASNRSEQARKIYAEKYDELIKRLYNLKNYVNDIRYGVNFLTKEDEEELDILLEKIDDKIQSEEHKKRTELSEARLLFEY